MWYCYILACADGSYYTGITNDLKARLEKHNLGKGARYTRSRRPVTMIYRESFRTQRQAMKRERQIKKLRRSQKQILIFKR